MFLKECTAKGIPDAALFKLFIYKVNIKWKIKTFMLRKINKFSQHVSKENIDEKSLVKSNFY